MWPTAGTARVTLAASADSRADTGAGAMQVGGLPMVVERAAGTAGTQWSALEVRVLDRAAAPAGWRDGVLLRVGTRGRGGGHGEAVGGLRGFRSAYGGDWASRLRLWQLPESR